MSFEGIEFKRKNTDYSYVSDIEYARDTNYIEMEEIFGSQQNSERNMSWDERQKLIEELKKIRTRNIKRTYGKEYFEHVLKEKTQKITELMNEIAQNKLNQLEIRKKLLEPVQSKGIEEIKNIREKILQKELEYIELSNKSLMKNFQNELKEINELKNKSELLEKEQSEEISRIK